MSLMVTRSGRSRWPWIGGPLVAAAIAVVIVVLVLGPGRSSSTVADPTVSATPAASPTPTAGGGDNSGTDGDVGAPPTGCLGGAARTAATVLSAQAQAPHSLYGAVEFAAAYERFIAQFPYPDDSATSEVNAASVAAASHQRMDASAARYEQIIAQNGQLGSSAVPRGSDFYLSSVGGTWLVAGDSTTDKVVVSMNLPYVVDGVLSPTAAAASSLTVVWENGVWKVSDASLPNVAALSAGGTQFTSGC